ncbi:MAG: MBL fold metallo-hydrolase [Alphaproteobacteria bacterium]|nr:MBL fold metallo-hydrolase [Alphaproteobacteria bacterium]
MDGSAISVRFWGVRGSIACAGPQTARYGGNTACVELRCGGHTLVFDAGTGIRPLGLALAREPAADLDLFFSHTHLDHVLGLPFFAPALTAGRRLRLWAGHLLPAMTLEAAVRRMMTPPLFPVPVETLRADLEFRDFRAGETLRPCTGVTVRTAPLDHPDGATGYRVEHGGRAVAYVTDIEHRPGERAAAVVDLVRGADLMIYDSTYTDAEFVERKGWGHSTWEEALRVADAAGVGRVVLFHHDPGHDDDFMDAVAAAAAISRPGTVVAREGETLTA